MKLPEAAKIKDILKKSLLFQHRHPVLPGAVILIVMLLLVIALWSNTLPYRMRYPVKTSIKYCMWIMTFYAVFLGIDSVIHIRRKEYGETLKKTGIALLYLLLAGFFLSGSVLYDYIGPVKDHFADNLTLPEGVELKKPAPPFGTIDYRHAPPKSFQYSVLNVNKRSETLADDEQITIPSLAEVMDGDEKSGKLLNYLAANPNWRLYKDSRGGTHAIRRFTDAENNPVPAADGFYSYFGKDPDDRYTFHLDIGLDGRSWNGRFFRSGVDIDPSHRNRSKTRFFSGEASVEIIEECGKTGRRMTLKSCQFLENEFSQLESGDIPNFSYQRTPGISLRGERGVYTADIFCNPGEPGTIYLKAFEITENIPLSEYRLRNNANEVIGFSDNFDEQFFSQLRFTIYEGDWGQFYGMRLEVWFIPDESGSPEIKLLEDNFLIEGWMRSPDR